MRDVDLFGQALGLTEPWRVERSEFDAAGHRLDLYLDFTAGGRFDCPSCGAPGCPVHDTSRRSWRHLTFFEREAHLHARVPRVRCDRCGVRQVAVPWARPESGFSLLFEAFVMALVAEMPVKAVAELVGEHDTRIWQVLHHYVRQARAAADFSATARVGLDETSRRRGHHSISLFVDLDRPRLVFATPGRGAEVLGRFKADLVAHAGRPEAISELVMDMAPPFIAAAAEHFPAAAITFDRFHVMWNLGFAIDEVRRAEERDGGRGLKRSRSLWLRRSDALTDRQQAEFERLAAADPPTGRAYRLKLAFEDFWHQPPDAAEAYLEAWCRWAEHSRLGPIIEFAKLVRRHWRGILRWATSRVSNGILEATASLIQAANSSLVNASVPRGMDAPMMTSDNRPKTVRNRTFRVSGRIKAATHKSTTPTSADTTASLTFRYAPRPPEPRSNRASRPGWSSSAFGGRPRRNGGWSAGALGPVQPRLPARVVLVGRLAAWSKFPSESAMNPRSIQAPRSGMPLPDRE